MLSFDRLRDGKLGRMTDESPNMVEHDGDDMEPARLDDELSSTVLTIKRDTRRCCNTNTFTQLSITFQRLDITTVKSKNKTVAAEIKFTQN
jgi:hypothetical protein